MKEINVSNISVENNYNSNRQHIVDFINSYFLNVTKDIVNPDKEKAMKFIKDTKSQPTNSNPNMFCIVIYKVYKVHFTHLFYTL